MTNVISPKGRCRIATERCRLRLRNIPTEAEICSACERDGAERLRYVINAVPNGEIDVLRGRRRWTEWFLGGAFLGGDASPTVTS